MAGDWLKMRTDLFTQRRVVTMARLLSDAWRHGGATVAPRCGADSVTRYAVIGSLLTVWGQMRHQGIRVDADLVVDALGLAGVDDLLGWDGFAAAMVEVDWLREDGDDLVFPGFFANHNRDPTETKREKHAERQRRYRERKAARDGCATVAPRERHRGATASLSNSHSKDSASSIKPASKQHQPDIKPPSTATNIEAIYQAYPRHVGKRVAHKAIEKALKHIGYPDLLAAVTEYAAAVSGSDKKFVPHPATWFNNRRWEDDREEWKDEGRNGKPKRGAEATIDAAQNWAASFRGDDGPDGGGQAVPRLSTNGT